MHVRSTRFIFASSAVVLGAATVATWAFVIAQPARLPTDGLQDRQDRVVQTVDASTMDVTDAQLQQVAQVNLRRPLHDPPPPTPAPPPPPVVVPPLSIHLAGTIYEPGHCKAMIRMPDGTTSLKSVGDTAGDATIVQIGDGQITVLYAGHSQVLAVEKNKN